MKIKLIVFDFDGVIENTYEKHLEFSKKNISGLTREEHRKLFEGNVHTEREKLSSRLTGFDFRKHFVEYRSNLKIKPEIRAELLKLSEGYTLGIITSSREKSIRSYLDQNNLTQLFSFVYGYETEQSKTEKFELVMKKFNLTKKEIIFVADTLGDILEAKKAGIETIGIDSGFHEKSRLEKGKPLRIISRFSQVLPTVKELEI